jgi:hypothetical protein
VAFHLRAFHFRIPIRALDQAYWHAPAYAAGQVGEEVDHIRGALLIGLHGQAVAFPAVQRFVRERGFDQVQREFQAVGFFGVDGEADAVGLGQLRQLQDARREFGHDPGALGVLVARVQGGQLDRDAGSGEDIGEWPRLSYRMDRFAIGLQIARGIFRSQRALAQHVE